jgi:hypothetical protein
MIGTLCQANGYERISGATLPFGGCNTSIHKRQRDIL